MESQNKELSTKSTENSLEQLLDEDEDVFYETGMGSIIDLIYQTWITNSFVKNVRTMKDALLSFLESLKTRGLLNSMYSMEELNRFFSTPESKVLQNLFMEDFITKNTFFEWLHDLKECVRCHMVTLSDASNIDCEIFTSSAEVKSGGMNALFASTSKEQTDGISQYITGISSEVIAGLRKARSYVKAKLSRLRTQTLQIIQEEGEINREHAEARLDKLEEIYRGFEAIQWQLLDQVSELSEDDARDEEAFEKKYYQVKILLKKSAKMPPQGVETDSSGTIVQLLQHQAELIQ
ncbi:hypothetical protein ALC57_14542 [Trachymyrmex cornetzi]|uniref:Uncharacterized protein n=1 Tax=Trachymyrmex cornetzi TaxID=471704 RepID=A0A151IYG0_9HYME|nr:hypothetical protein ALC57_14542 [Trachymyrmex cornetzi]